MYILKYKMINGAFNPPYFWVGYLAVIAYPFPHFWLDCFVVAANAAA